MRSVLPKLVLLGLSTLMALAIAEIGVRIAMPQTLSIWSHMRDGQVVHRPNIRGHMTTLGRRIDTNSIGMRDVEHPDTPEPGTYRVLLLGDSFMEAMQVEWSDTLAAQLAVRLKGIGPERIEIVNASVSGWGTDDQLIYFRRIAHAWAPDLILVGMTLHNDVSDNLALEFHDFQAGRIVERPETRIELPTWQRLQVQEWLASNSHLYRFSVGTLRARQVASGAKALNRHLIDLVRKNPSERLDAGWAITHQLLDALHADGRAIGADLAVFLIPLAIQVTDDRLADFLEGAGLAPSELDLERPQRLMRAWGERAGVEVIDLLPAFRDWTRETGRDPYLLVDGHWDERGHTLGARIVASELESRSLLGDNQRSVAGIGAPP